MSALRILDANLNRAREALRVAEDYARFVTEDAVAAGRLKAARHALREIAGMLGPQLLAERAADSDVGREIKTPAEGRRTGSQDVCAAAFKRVAEALRSIEEYAKPISQPAAQRAERLRYECYELESRVLLRSALAQRLAAAALYVIVTDSLCSGPWLDVAEAALRGGAACLQLREKALTDGELLNRARRLRELTRRYDALLIINDRPDLARLAEADGVHLGQDDLATADARRIAGGRALIGRSTHTPAQVETAMADQADYIAVGPMFLSATRPSDHIPGTALLTAACERAAVPVVAIGGITPANVKTVRAAGRCVVCVCAAVISSPDPAGAARALIG